jgi:hypothetical protein
MPDAPVPTARALDRASRHEENSEKKEEEKKDNEKKDKKGHDHTTKTKASQTHVHA